MSDAKVKRVHRGRRQGSGWYYSKDGQFWTSPYNYALQSEIDETKRKTRERSCFSACATCGHCKNSRRGCTHPFSNDRGNTVFCEGCEKFGFCDCVNGNLRNAHGDAEPFTEEAQKLFDQGGKPLI